MKKILLVLLLFHGQVFALEKESTLKFYHHVFDALFTKSVISVYVDSIEYKNVFSTSKHIHLVNNMKNADIVLITNDLVLKNVLTLETRPILFATQYRFLENSKEVIGAFYWKKGRAQLLFVEERLKKQGIKLPFEYKKYMVNGL